MSNFGHERKSNPFVADAVLARGRDGRANTSGPG
jgi:hypothetical protein